MNEEQNEPKQEGAIMKHEEQKPEEKQEPTDARGQLIAIVQVLHELRQIEKDNRKAIEKRLEALEENFIELKVKLKERKK